MKHPRVAAGMGRALGEASPIVQQRVANWAADFYVFTTCPKNPENLFRAFSTSTLTAKNSSGRAFSVEVSVGGLIETAPLDLPPETFRSCWDAFGFYGVEVGKCCPTRQNALDIFIKQKPLVKTVSEGVLDSEYFRGDSWGHL